MSILGDVNTAGSGGTTDGGASGNGGQGTGVSNTGTGSAASGGGSGGGASSAAAGGSGGGDGGSKSWRDGLPDDLKNDQSLAQFSDVTNLAKSYLSTKSMVGKKGVIVPNDKSSDEEWAAFYDAAGRPPLDKYEVKTPDGLEINKEFVGKFKEAVHKQGVLPKQAQAILDFYIGTEKEMVASQQAAQIVQEKAALGKLKEEWGDGYQRKIEAGEFALKQTGLDPEWVKRTGLGKDPTFIKFLADKVAPLYGEDKIRGEGAGPMGGQTPGEMDAEIQKLQAHPAYLDRNHREHKIINQQMDAFYQRKYPNKTG